MNSRRRVCHRNTLFSAVCAALFALSAPGLADVTPAALFQDALTLQRGKKIPVWGKADPAEKVTVTLKDVTVTGAAGPDGKWRVELPPFDAESRPQVMIIAGRNRIEIRNVLIGEVFVAGGQSNMEVPVREAMNPREEAAAADYPQIREFAVANDWNDKPQDDCAGKWTVVQPTNAPGIGAVAYYFARELHKTLGVPVGIINNAVSATPAEAWTPREALEARPDVYQSYIEPMKQVVEWGKDKIVAHSGEITKRITERRAKMKDRIRMVPDEGPRYIENETLAKDIAWIQGPLPPKGWTEFDIIKPCPLYNEDTAGAFRFRKTFTLPDGAAGVELKLALTTADGVTAYLDGVRLVPAAPNDRGFIIPAAAAKAGEHTLALRYFREFNRTPFDNGKAPSLVAAERAPTVLDGLWGASAEEELPSIQWPADPFMRVMRTGSVLYNAMVKPLAPFAVRGVIWYQGESNQNRPALYATLFSDMITAWRKTWGEELPFYFVQLAAYERVETNPNAHGGWAWLRDAQEKALALTNTAMATAIDIGDAERIHPLNKQEVGRRLAAIALNKLYGKAEVVCEYPQFDSITFEDGKAVVTIRNARTLKSADGQPIRAFAIADKPGYNRFRWAQVELAGNKVILTHPDLKTVSMARYAWASNPDVNLVNEYGLPVLPFAMKRK